ADQKYKDEKNRALLHCAEALDAAAEREHRRYRPDEYEARLLQAMAHRGAQYGPFYVAQVAVPVVVNPGFPSNLIDRLRLVDWEDPLGKIQAQRIVLGNLQWIEETLAALQAQPVIEGGWWD